MKFKIVSLGDLHLPYSHRPSVNKAIDFIEYVQPDYVVQQGDLYDLPSQGRFPKRMNIIPVDEMKLAHQEGDLLWSLIRKVAPKASLHQIRGNHDIRPSKLLLERAPQLEPFMNFDSFWNFSHHGVETIYDPREVLEIEDIAFTHGHLSKLGAHMEALEFTNTVCGHSHRGGVFYRRLKTGRVVWELNAGYLADPFHEHLLYRPLNKFFHWTHGIGFIDEFGPRFIPF